MQPTTSRIRGLLNLRRSGVERVRVPPDTLAFALATLEQVLPPTAPSPDVTPLEVGGLLFQWSAAGGTLELDVVKPNEIVLMYGGEVLRASIDLNAIAKICWAELGESNVSGQSFAMDRPARVSSLPAGIEAAFPSASVDPEYEEVARHATSDATVLARREFPTSHPVIELAEDGVLTLQWQSESKGLIIVFTGDGTATYSVKELGGRYATNGTEFELKAGLPAGARAAIEEIEGA
jgi:hypothetical protein